MRLILLIFISVFIHQTVIKADDIREFEIEGISIGDSLPEFGSENQIKNIKSSKQYKSKYIIFDADILIEMTNYDYMSVTTKNNDINYIITSVSGIINYEKLENCLEMQKEIAEQIDSLLIYNEKKEVVYPSQRDKTGNSKIHSIVYYFKPYPSNEAISINCGHFTNKSKIQRTLKVGAKSDEFAYYLINKAYKLRTMKFIISLVILIFSLQYFAKAEDIRDFQIEGITIRDSLLEYFSLDEIKKFHTYFYKNKEYKIIQTSILSDNYDLIEVTVKNGDNNYKIYQVLGGIFYENNIKNCHIKQKEIESEFTNIFTNNIKKRSWEKNIQQIKRAIALVKQFNMNLNQKM